MKISAIGQLFLSLFIQLEKSISEKERLAFELEQKLDSEKQVAQSAKTMLENKISEAQASKSEWQDLKHQVQFGLLSFCQLIVGLKTINHEM